MHLIVPRIRCAICTATRQKMSMCAHTFRSIAAAGQNEVRRPKQRPDARRQRPEGRGAGQLHHLPG